MTISLAILSLQASVITLAAEAATVRLDPRTSLGVLAVARLAVLEEIAK